MISNLTNFLKGKSKKKQEKSERLQIQIKNAKKKENSDLLQTC